MQLWHQFFLVSILNPVPLVSGDRVFLPLTLHRPVWLGSFHSNPAETDRAQDYFPSFASENCHTSTKYRWWGFPRAQTAQQGEQGSGWWEEECRGGRNSGSLKCKGDWGECNPKAVCRKLSPPQLVPSASLSLPWGEILGIPQQHLWTHTYAGVTYLLSVVFERSQSELFEFWIRVLSPPAPYMLFLQVLLFPRRRECPHLF